MSLEARNEAQAGSAAAAAAALVVGIGLLLAGIVAYRTAFHARAEYTDTLHQGRSVTETLVHFARAAQRLPCPADPAAATADLGTEAGTPGACSHPDGVVPWRTLGLPEATSLDEWGNRLTYRVDETLTASTVSFSGTAAGSGLSVCREFPCGVSPAIDRDHTDGGAPFLVLSHGRNGRGAHLPNGGAGLAPEPGGPEAANTGPDPTDPFYDLPETPPGEYTAVAFFDDLAFLPDLRVKALFPGSVTTAPPVFTAPGGDGSSSFSPDGTAPGSPSDSPYSAATTVNGQPALNLYSATGALLGTVTADMGVSDTSVNSGLTWDESTGLGVDSSGGGGPGGGPNDAMERAEGVVMAFTSHYRSAALAMYDLQGTVSATRSRDAVFVYLFRRADPASTAPVAETSALRQFALPACSASNNTKAIFNSLKAGRDQVFDVMKIAVQADSNNNVKNNIFGMALSDAEQATLTITGALSPCPVWYCDTPNSCGTASNPWRVYDAANPG